MTDSHGAGGGPEDADISGTSDGVDAGGGFGGAPEYAGGDGSADDGKSPDAFRTISEVADDLDLPQHVLRFWETRFTHIRPLKRGGSRRYYRPQDVALLRGIRVLLYGQGYTIKGVQRILKEQGPRHVAAVGEGRAGPSGVAAMADGATPGAVLATGAVMASPAPAPDPLARPRPGQPLHSPAAAAASQGTVEQRADASHGALIRRPAGFTQRGRSAEVDPGDDAPPAAMRPARVGSALSAEDVARLNATLADLLECKRILDQTR